MQRAASSVSRALTHEGLMSQDYFEEGEAGVSLIAVLAPRLSPSTQGMVYKSRSSASPESSTP
jgi:hypothetical protein